ncbi:sodium-independent anion transporter [Portibacter lacus]|uniref:Sodium-independent anion transporter n=2 Tax=Portibacter lacus TaxID=1099794 RepID=A0AA37SL03_9BACT|nr:sodium-independent anion transporter [Portibacter lacus]
MLRHDFIAGITVATILVPQGLAYALLAGVPPIYGLYTAIVPLIVYAILGTSRQLAIGPVAISSLLVLSGVSSIATPGTDEFLGLVITAGLLIGFCQWLLGLVRLGFIANFISLPVITGFSSAAAVIILSTQLRDALGIVIPRFDSVFSRLGYTMEHLGETSFLTTVICGGAIAIMLILKAINKKIPGALFVIIIGLVLVYFFNLDEKGVDIIGVIPEGLPSFSIPDLSIGKIKQLIPVVLTVTTIGIVECVSIAKTLQAKHKDYDIDVDQELIAIGASKMVGAFFQSIPSSGSFSRSAINSSAGAKTTIAAFFTVGLISLTLIFLTPLFYYLPSAVLAAIILLAVVGLFDIKEVVHLWKTHKRDFLMMVVTFVCTLIFGIEEGVLIGVVISIASVLIKSSKPHVAILGKVPGTNEFRNIKRFEDAIEYESTVIVRFDEQLYFANAGYFKDKVSKIINIPKYAKLKYFVLDASNMHNIDSTGIKILHDITSMLKSRGIELHMCGVKGPVRDMLYKNQMLTEIEKHHMNINAAIDQLQTGKPIKNKGKALQTNFRR